MKKLFAAVIALSMIFAAFAASAEVLTLSEATLDIGDMQQAAVEEEDAEEGATYCLYNEDDTLEIYIYEYENDGYDAQSILSEMQSATGDDAYTATGLTTINGIDCAYGQYNDEEGWYATEYDFISGDELVMVTCFYQDETGAQAHAAIMNTLQ